VAEEKMAFSELTLFTQWCT